MVDMVSVLSADQFEGNSANSHNGFKPTKHDGVKIDALILGSRVRARAGYLYRTDVPPRPHWSCRP